MSLGEQVLSDGGKVPLPGIYADNLHKIILTVNGENIGDYSTLAEAKTAGKIKEDEDNKFYLDLTIFEAGDEIEIEYFSK